MWIQRKIREDLESIEPRCLEELGRIGTLPLETAVRIAAYLWEGCFQSCNDVWAVLCGGLLYEIPPEWLEEHIREVLACVSIDWNDEFEFCNLCAAVCHMPEALETVLAYAGERMTPEHAKEWMPDTREMKENREHYKQILKYYGEMDHSEWKR